LLVTYVALARIYEHFDRNEEAVQLYDKALTLGTKDDPAFKEALAGKQRLMKQP
jgi:hypothetical protein